MFYHIKTDEKNLEKAKSEKQTKFKKEIRNATLEK